MSVSPAAVAGAVDVLHRRPDLRGLFPLAEALDQAARWTA